MYRTSRLSDVADHFEQNAASAIRAAEKAKAKTTKRDLSVEAAIWKHAADFIRNVEIIQMETR